MVNIQQENPKKRILYLITKAGEGGAQKYVYDLATSVPTDRYEAIVAYGEGGKLAEDLRRAGIALYPIPSLSRDIAFISDIRSFFLIQKCIRELRPDVVHLNSSKAAGLGALAARIAGIPKIVFTVHGWPFGESRNVFAKLILWKISWLTALLSHTVICVSEYDLQKTRRMPFVAHKAVRIYNGLDVQMVFNSGERIRNAFPAGVRITGTVGELHRNKNHIALVEQAKTDPALFVAIVGEGEERPALEKKIREYGLEAQVKLFGFIPAQEVLRGFDVFALPSLKEGLPYALLEAKLASLPIVANRVGGVGEILDKNIEEFDKAIMVQKTIALY